MLGRPGPPVKAPCSPAAGRAAGVWADATAPGPHGRGGGGEQASSTRPVAASFTWFRRNAPAWRGAKSSTQRPQLPHEQPRCGFAGSDESLRGSRGHRVSASGTARARTHTNTHRHRHRHRHRNRHRQTQTHTRMSLGRVPPIAPLPKHRNHPQPDSTSTTPLCALPCAKSRPTPPRHSTIHRRRRTAQLPHTRPRRPPTAPAHPATRASTRTRPAPHGRPWAVRYVPWGVGVEGCGAGGRAGEAGSLRGVRGGVPGQAGGLRPMTASPA